MSRVIRGALMGAFACVVGSCVGAGDGSVSGTVHVPVCHLDGPYNLHADFYGANRNGATLWIRIQDGGGPAEYADGFWITIDDTTQVVAAIAASTERDSSGNPIATLPVGMRGDPGVIVHATLTLDWSCGRHKVTRLGENVGLWAYQGTMTFRAIDNPLPGNDGPRITDVTNFSLQMHDPRPVGANPPDTIDPNSPVGDAQMTGSFRFHYTRAVPAQFFP